MELPDVKQLEALLAVCRKKGVSSISFGELKIRLRVDEPQSPYKKKQIESQVSDETDTNDKYKNFPDGVLSPEQLIFYSSGGIPEDWGKEAKE